jgi:hypothetical protein
MDMSKLPRMSQTPPPPPDATPEPSADEGRATRGVAAEHPQRAYRQEVDYAAEPAVSLAEAWISIAIGLILMFVSTAGRFLEYLTSSNFSWNFTDPTGAPLPYRQTVFFWGDVAIFAFSLLLIVDGLILFTRKPALVTIALAFTIITVLMNFIYVVRMMNGYGFQLWSAIAVAFGVYIAIFQWRLLQSLRISRAFAR